MKTLIKRIITGLAIGTLFWISFTQLPPIIFSLILMGILVQILLFEWHRIVERQKGLLSVMTPLYPILPFTLLIALNHHPLYRPLLFILFILVFSFDTGSYFAGNIFGKNRIAPHISPGKTWEGFAGGLLCAVLGLLFMFWELSIHKNIIFAVGFSLIVCLLSLAGDLFESWLKRRAHLKDSGDFLPGHGGFLDRFDGIMFAVFFFYFFRQQLIHLFGL